MASKSFALILVIVVAVSNGDNSHHNDNCQSHCSFIIDLARDFGFFALLPGRLELTSVDYDANALQGWVNTIN